MHFKEYTLKIQEGGENIPDYQKLYTLLFNAVTDALSALDQQNFGTAKDLLILAQQQAEERYIEDA